MEAAAVAASSASAEPGAACPRLDDLPGRDLPGGLRLAEARTRPARMKGLARLDAMPGISRSTSRAAARCTPSRCASRST